MKSMIIGVSGLLLLAGCSGNQPTPVIPVADANKTVIVDANKSIVPKNKSYKRNNKTTKTKTKTTKNVSKNGKPKKNVKVPPLPTPEVDIDMDSIIDQATDEIVT